MTKEALAKQVLRPDDLANEANGVLFFKTIA
jgi:hypothetical protein